MIVRLKLSGLKCKGCIAKVRKDLQEAGAIVRGIGLNEVELEISEGQKVENFIEVIRKAGYNAEIASN